MVEQDVKRTEDRQTIPAILDTLKNMRKNLADTVEKTRNLAAMPRPSMLDTLGIVEALEWQLQEFRKHSGISISFRSSTSRIEGCRNHRSMHPEERYALRALQSGAAGYIPKGSASGDLIRAIRKGGRGGRYVSESLAEKLASYLAKGIRTAPYEKPSRREFQVVLLLGVGNSVKEISAELALSPNTCRPNAGVYSRRWT